MSDKEMISKAFASLKAPDDTLERIEEKMNHTRSSIPASDTTANSIQRGGF